jgi:nicotinamidase-related amidase
MAATDNLLKPEECAMLLVDFQAGLGFGVESMPVQVVLNNAVALARTGAAFKIPVHRLQRRVCTADLFFRDCRKPFLP